MRKELVQADKLLCDAAQDLPLSVVTPVNEKYVRQQVLSGKVKNPVLKYKLPPTNLLELRRKVSSLAIEEQDGFDSLVVDKQMDIVRKIDLINSVGCFDFTERSRKLYGAPSQKLVNKAYEILGKKPEPERKSPRVLSKDAMKIIKANLKKFGLNYKVRKADIVTSAVIAANRKTIVLKKKARFSESFINRLIVHEIGTHALRYENGAKQKLDILRTGLANYLETEEGLAVYNEKRFGVLRESYLRNYAGRVVAVNIAQDHDFATTFKEMRKFFSKKTAFQLTLRAKRGLSQTDVAGGFTKDHLYLKGYFKVKRYIKKGGKIEDLYYGKVGVDDLETIKRLPLKKPKLLPKDFILFEEKTPLDVSPAGKI